MRCGTRRTFLGILALALLLSGADSARALQKYSSWLQDQTGRALTGVSVTVYRAGTATKATLYSDDGVTALANPFTNNSPAGNFSFFAVTDKYDLVFSKGGYAFATTDTSALTVGVIVDSVTTAGLPAAGIAGRLARVTDGGAMGALVIDDGVTWTCDAAKAQKLTSVTCPPYNAKSDGTDARAAFQSALTVGGNVFVPGDETTIYTIASTLTIPSNTTLYGAATLKLQAGASTDLLQNSDAGGGNVNIRILNLTLDVNSANTTGNIRAIRLENTTRSVVAYTRVRNVRLGGITLREGSSDNKIIGNIIDTYGIGGVGQGITLFRNCNRNVVAHNTISTGGTTTVGILVDDASSGDGTSAPSTSNVIAENVLLNPVQGIDLEGGSYNTVIGNTIVAPATDGIIVQTGNVFNVVNSNTSIIGNTVTGLSGTGGAIAFSGQGILVADNLVEGTTGAGRSYLLKGEGAGAASSEITIRGNIARNPNAAGTGEALRIAPTTLTALLVEGNVLIGSRAAAISASGGGRTWRIAGNIIETPQTDGIAVAHGATTMTDLLVTDNVIRDPSQAAVNTSDGINVSGTNLTRAYVRRNVAVDTTAKMRYGVRISSGASVEEEDNQISGAQTASISNLASSILATGSTTTGFRPFTFANIGTVLTADGQIGHCSDCSIANPCAGGGTGAIAKRLNAVNVCN